MSHKKSAWKQIEELATRNTILFSRTPSGRRMLREMEQYAAENGYLDADEAPKKPRPRRRRHKADGN